MISYTASEASLQLQNTSNVSSLQGSQLSFFLYDWSMLVVCGINEDHFNLLRDQKFCSILQWHLSCKVLCATDTRAASTLCQWLVNVMFTEIDNLCPRKNKSMHV